MRIDSLHLENFKRFESAVFNFQNRFNLIVGENATGKTAILDALAIGLGGLLQNFPDPAQSRNFYRDDVRLGFFSYPDSYTIEPQFPVKVECRGEVDSQLGNWKRELNSAGGRTTRQDLSWIRYVADGLIGGVKAGNEDVVLPVLSYYGTGRLWLQKRNTLQNRSSEIKTLKRQSRFVGYRDCLNPASDEKKLVQWFKTNEISAIQRQEKNLTLEACRLAVLSCLPEANRFFFDVARDELVLKTDDKELPFRYLSDGFRNIVAMVADIAVRCATLNPNLANEASLKTPGVVLIDEIDLHLHPKWQRRIVRNLLETFPQIQFIATTHSPFIIQSLPATAGIDLINLDDAEADEFENKSLEDISETVQGVEVPQRSQRYLEMMDAATKYYEILNQQASVNPNQLQSLKERLDELSIPFSDDPAYQAFLKMQREASGLGRDEPE